MARDLSKLTNKISAVAKESFEKANEKKVIWIKDENLLDHPLNDEDLLYTEDIEEHIKTEGFRYPITVTKYGCDEKDKYYIVSGHRSRRAGRNLGKTEFPCIVEDYASETDVYHAILSGNTRRNKDPLDLANRYLKWDKYLDMTEFKGNRAEKIGKCLGISQKQAEKYKAFTKIIPEFWTLVREKEAAKDGLYQLAPKSVEEQQEIYNFFLICNPNDNVFTVKLEKDIINAWRLGIRTYDDFTQYISGTVNDILKKSEIKLNETVPEMETAEENDDIPKENIKESVYERDSVLDDVDGGHLERKIEGHNNNELANIDFKENEKKKYAEERLTKEDEENAATASRITVKNTEENNGEEDKDIAENTEECVKYFNELLTKLSSDNTYDTLEKAEDVIKELVEGAIKMLNIADNVRDENMAYDAWDESREQLKQYLNEQIIPWN